LSARDRREAGFDGNLASGLCNLGSIRCPRQQRGELDAGRGHAGVHGRCSDLPILLDGDTGYGNFNNMRRLVRKLEQRGIAGVCIEDKQFPKPTVS